MIDDNQKSPSDRRMFDLLKIVRVEFLVVVICLAVVGAAEGIVHPILIKYIFDQGVLRHSFNQFVLYMCFYLGFGLLVVSINAIGEIWRTALENRVARNTIRRMLEAYYRKDYGEILLNGDGYFINRIHGDVHEGLIPLMRLVQTATRQVASVLGMLGVLIYLSWQVFLLLAILIPVAAVIGSVIGGKIKNLTTLQRDQEGAALAILSKALGAFRIVRGFDAAGQTVTAFDERLNDSLLTGYRLSKVTRTFQAINSAIMNISDFCSMFVGALFVLRGALTFGGYLAFVNTFWRTITNLMQLLNYSADYYRLMVMTRRILSFVSSTGLVYHKVGDSPLVAHVDFAYGETIVLEDISLSLKAGERVAIIGPNGSGKTTLINILAGYLAPLHGDVVLPASISAITLPIAFPPVRIRELLCDKVLLSTFGFEEKHMDAYADELSSGQQQKLALALALSRQAQLYIFDEPLSNVDEESKDIVMETLLERTKGKTTILIMHGLDGQKHSVDRVIQISDLKAGAVVAA